MLKNQRRGAAGQQYAIVVGLIAVIAIASISVLGASAGRLMQNTSNTMTRVVNGSGAGSSSGQTAPASANNVYYQCNGKSNYVVFAQNVNGLTVNSLATTVSACQAYGFKALGTGYVGGTSDRGYGVSDNAYMNTAIDCHNCYWSDGGNPWYGHRNGTQICSHVSGTAPMGAKLGGVVINGLATNVNCASFRQNLGPSTQMTWAEQSSGSTNPFYQVNYNNAPNNDAACPNRGERTPLAINFNGVPEYVLCSSATILP